MAIRKRTHVVYAEKLHDYCFLNIQVRELELMDIEKLPNCNKDPGKARWSSMNEQKR